MLNAAAERGGWVGTASDFLRAATSLGGDDISKRSLPPAECGLK